MVFLASLLKSIPALYRKIVYFVFAFAIVVVTAVQVWYGAIPDTGPVPDWTVRALAVLAYIGVPLGLTAGVNVGPEDNPPPSPGPGFDVTERGAVETRTIAWAALIIAVLALFLIFFGVRVDV